MTKRFLKLLRYQPIHTPAEGIYLRSDQRESHMVEEHPCVKEVTEEHVSQGHNSSCCRHICTVSA